MRNLNISAETANVNHVNFPYSNPFSTIKPASLALIQRNPSLYLFSAPKTSSLALTRTRARMSDEVLQAVEPKKQHKEETDVESGENNEDEVTINGTVILMKKTVLGFHAFHASLMDQVDELAGRKISLQLVSAVYADPGMCFNFLLFPSSYYLRPKTNFLMAAYLNGWSSTFSGWKSGESAFKISFQWDKDMGIPGGLIIRNEHHHEFYLKNVTLTGFPDHDEVHFVCNSWVYPAECYKKDRIFFSNKVMFIRFLRRINTTSTKTYATRTLLFLKNDGTLRPLAIELSLPHRNGDQLGAVSKVYTPAEDGVERHIWQLAKAYVSVNDSGYHQLISHWLSTHAVIEPFVIATNRQLSVLHPILKLLQPHFHDTMSINALARQILIGAGGILEITVFPRKYAMEMSSLLYKNWVFTDQALPKDLVKRGMAVKDSESPHGIRLLIEDYPYAVDGLDVWSAIESWVKDYCSYYYKDDEMIINDTELQAWWKEVREKGHGDLKDEQWWPQMKNLEELTEACTIIIWVASALHAAVNFGQYPYAGYLPNRPTVSRRFMPEPGTPEYEELTRNPETAYLKTITSQFQTLLGISLIEILSRHSSDEIYLGQRDTREWTSDTAPIEAFNRFRQRLEEIEREIVERNDSRKYRNRFGPVNMPYTLLIPSSEGGLTARGIPNSVTI